MRPFNKYTGAFWRQKFFVKRIAKNDVVVFSYLGTNGIFGVQQYGGNIRENFRVIVADNTGGNINTVILCQKLCQLFCENTFANQQNFFR